MSFPVSSEVHAADEITNSGPAPLSLTSFFMMNSAMGLLQMFPVQRNRIFILPVKRNAPLEILHIIISHFSCYAPPVTFRLLDICWTPMYIINVSTDKSHI